MNSYRFIECDVFNPALFTSDPIAAYQLDADDLEPDQVDACAQNLANWCAQTLLTDKWKVSIFKGKQCQYDIDDPNVITQVGLYNARSLWILFYDAANAATFKLTYM